VMGHGELDGPAVDDQMNGLRRRRRGTHATTA
jgi:hypothetical protein